jgi:hypothetical protein
VQIAVQQRGNPEFDTVVPRHVSGLFNRRTVSTLLPRSPRMEFVVSRFSKLFVAIVIVLTPLTTSGCGSFCLPGGSCIAI